jgi:hypothetical protein
LRSLSTLRCCRPAVRRRQHPDTSTVNGEAARLIRNR